MKAQHDKAFNKTATVGTSDNKRMDRSQRYETTGADTSMHTQLVTCGRVERDRFGEDRSSISEQLDPEDERLIWSAGSFFEPSLGDSKLRTENMI